MNQDLAGSSPEIEQAESRRTKVFIGLAHSANSPLVFVLLLLIIILAYYSTWASVLNRWITDPTYSHGFLVLALSAWMLCRAFSRNRLNIIPTNIAACFLVLLLGLLWYVANAATVEMLSQVSLAALIFTSVFALYGRPGLQYLGVPLGIVFLVVPVWDVTRPLLQWLTTSVVGVFLDIAEIPAFISGFFVQLPAGTFEIAEGCSGLHFLMAATVLGAVQGELSNESPLNRAKAMAIFVMLALIANWIRVTAIVVAGHMTEMNHWLIDDHYYFGWAVFAFLVLPVIWFGHSPAASSISPSVNLVESRDRVSRATSVIWLFVLVALPSLLWHSRGLYAEPTDPPSFPTRLDNAVLVGDASRSWQPTFHSADEFVGKTFHVANGTADVWFAFYGNQRSGREAIGYGNAFFGKSDGRIISEKGRAPIELRQLDGSRRLIDYRYIVAGVVTTSAMHAKLLQAYGVLMGSPSATVVISSTTCLDDVCDTMRINLLRFTDSLANYVADHNKSKANKD